VKEVYRHLFFDKVKSLGIDSCLYEIPKNDLVNIWAVACGHWSRSPNLDVYCYLIETPGDFTGEKLKAYNFVISGWVKPLQMLKRNSGYDSHDATSPFFPPSSLRLLPFSLFNEGLWISPWQNCWIKDVCRLVLEHFDGLMRLIIFPWNKKVNSPPHFLICLSPDDFRDTFCVAGVPLDAPGCGVSEG